MLPINPLWEGLCITVGCPIERFVHRLKKMVGNKAKVEARIVNAYIQIETSFLWDEYLGLRFMTNSKRLRSNEVTEGGDDEWRVSIFNYPDKRGSIRAWRILDNEEYSKAVHYILTNMSEHQEYFDLFHAQTRQQYLNIDDAVMYQMTLETYPTWLKGHVWEFGNTCLIYEWNHAVLMGFDWRVTCSTTYKVNGYKFNMESHSVGRPTVNSNVYVKVTKGNHFYVIIEDIIRVRCQLKHRMHVTLFKCRWFDPKNVKMYPSTGIIQINTNKVVLPLRTIHSRPASGASIFCRFPGHVGTWSRQFGCSLPREANERNRYEYVRCGISRGWRTRFSNARRAIEPLPSLADDMNYEYTADNPSTATESDISSPNEISDKE